MKIRLLFPIMLAIGDDVIIFVIAVLILNWIGIDIPLWALILSGFLILGATSISYFALRKSPELGFENMIGKSGVAVEQIKRIGTVKINGGLWFARAKGNDIIEAGTDIVVIDQMGLKLTVTSPTEGDPKQQMLSSPSNGDKKRYLNEIS